MKFQLLPNSVQFWLQPIWAQAVHIWYVLEKTGSKPDVLPTFLLELCIFIHSQELGVAVVIASGVLGGLRHLY